jgi:hypothetical protein
MNKKGINLMTTLVDILTAMLIVVVIFGGAVYFAGNPKARNQAYIAKDTAVTLDALFGTSDGLEADIQYPVYFKDVEVKAADNLVEVYPQGSPESETMGMYPYTQHGRFTSLAEVVMSPQLRFAKVGTTVALHPLQATIGGIALDTAADPASQRIAIISSGISWAGQLRQSLSVEGFPEGTPDSATLLITFESVNDPALHIIYGGTDTLVQQKSVKLANLVKEECAGRLDGVFDTIIVEQGEVASAEDVPRIIVRIPQQAISEDLSGMISVALKKYYGAAT